MLGYNMPSLVQIKIKLNSRVISLHIGHNMGWAGKRSDRKTVGAEGSRLMHSKFTFRRSLIALAAFGLVPAYPCFGQGTGHQDAIYQKPIKIAANQFDLSVLN